MNVHVSDHESCGTSWTKISKENSYQEHGLKEDRKIVWYLTESDQGSKARNTWNIYECLEDSYMVRSTLLNDRAVELSTARVSFSLIRCFVSEAALRSTHDQWRLGKAKLSGSRGSRMS